MRGFTLIEIIIVSAVVLILALGGTAAFFSFWQSRALAAAGQSVISILNIARSQTLSSASADSYGVSFSSSADVILFRGVSFNPADPDNKIQPLPERMELSEINIGGGTEVFFERLTGYPSTSGSVVLRDKRNIGDTLAVYLYPSGNAGFLPPSPEAGGRITDTRHLHFNLGWSIRNSAILKFSFNGGAGPDLEIDMTPFFNGDKTLFLWENDLNAGGNTERFRVETHQLSATDTLLSVIRSRDVNDLAVSIYIDNKNIVSYTAGGEASVGLYGGTMEVR